MNQNESYTLNSPPLRPLPSPSSQYNVSDSDCLNSMVPVSVKKEKVVFATLNISGNKISNKKTEISEFEKRANVFLLTEAFFDMKKVKFKNKLFLSTFQENKRGLIMLLDKKMKILEENILVPGRAMFIKAEFHKKIYNIIGIYAPAETSDTVGMQFYTKILDFLNSNPPLENLELFGDFNVDIKNSKKNGTKIILEEILNKFNLKDTAFCQKTEPLATWNGKGLRILQFSRIDYIFSNLNLTNLKFEQTPSSGDHDHICITYIYNEKKEIKTLRCKDSILMDINFLKETKTCIRDFLLLNSDQNIECENIMKNMKDQNISEQIKTLCNILTFDDLEFKELTILDLILKKVKRLHDDASFKQNKKEKNILTRIQINLQRKKINVRNNSTEANIKELEEVSKSLGEFYDTKKLANEAKIEEFRILKDGEINAKLFYEIKERKFSNKINHIEFENGDETIENDCIAETLTNHYKNCVENKKQLNDLDSYLKKHEINLKLNMPTLQLLDQKISEKEIFASIKKLKPGASTGISGQSRSFLMLIFQLIPKIFTQGINIYINKGAANKNFSWLKLRKVIFVKKANKKNNRAGSFRPISILECLFKVINRCLINRIDNLSNEIINKNQFGFVRNRSGASATRTIEIIQRAQLRTKNNYSIIFLDNKQAFDMISQEAIFHILEKMGFPIMFISWLKNVVQNGIAYTEINDIISETFNILTGTPQGSPSSSTLYTVAHNLIQLCYEKRQFRWKADIHGLEIPIISFADDGYTVIKIVSKDDIIEFFGFFKEFEKLIGLTLNNSKTEVLVYGPNRDAIKQWFEELNCGQCVEQTKHLGIQVNFNPELTAENTLNSVNERLQESIRRLTATKADLFRRKTLLNLGVHSKFNHVFQGCSIDKEHLEKIWDSISKAMWAKNSSEYSSKGRFLIAKDRLPASYIKGGLQLTDTVQKYKRINTEASFKLLKNYFFRQGDLLSNILEELLPSSLRQDGSKGIKKCIENLHPDILFLKQGLICLEQIVYELEIDKRFITGSSIYTSCYTTLFNKPTGELKRLLQYNDVKTIGHLIYFYDEHSHELDPAIIQQLEYIVLHYKEKVDNFDEFMQINHIHMILHAFPNIKKFRPKYIFKQVYEDKLNKMYEYPPALKTRNRDKTLNVSKEIYGYAYTISARLPLSSKYKSFCFNILNRTLYTASKGFKMNKEISGDCKKCIGIEENTVHLLLDCDNLSVLIWNEIDIAIKKLTQGKCNVDWQIILFHVKPKFMRYSLFKQIIIFFQLIKYDIYSRRNNMETSPRPQKIRAIIINNIRKTIRILKLRSKKVCELENLCIIMEERLIQNTYNKHFDNRHRTWIMS